MSEILKNIRKLLGKPDAPRIIEDAIYSTFKSEILDVYEIFEKIKAETTFGYSTSLNEWKAWPPAKDFLARAKENPLRYVVALKYVNKTSGHFPWFLNETAKSLAQIPFEFDVNAVWALEGLTKSEYGVDRYEILIAILEKSDHLNRDSQFWEVMSRLEEEIRKRNENWPSVDARMMDARLRAIRNPGRQPWQYHLWLEKFNCEEEAVLRVFNHASQAKGNVPTAKWSSISAEILSQANHQSFVDATRNLLTCLKDARHEIGGSEGDLVRGLMWCLGTCGNAQASHLLYEYLIACTQKIPNIGAKCPKGFDGAISALESIGTVESLAAISNAKQKVAEAQLRKKIAKALESGAAKMGVNTDKLEEIVVPDYGLSLPGVLQQQFGDITLRSEIQGGKVEIITLKGDKPVKAIPKATATQYAKEIKEFRALLKQIETTLRAQRDRIESLYTQNRSIPLANWQERYVQHPLLFELVKSLIWTFSHGSEKASALFYKGEWRTLEGNPFSPSEGSTVDLWHPLFWEVTEVERWRDLIFEQEIRQPFKQAFREIYVLTEAERTTNTYSNRFAAHILKQHQMAALGRVRGWRIQLQGFFDAAFEPPTRDLPAWGHKARFYTQIVDTADEVENMTDAGISLYVATDLVEFLDSRMERIPLTNIDPLEFSEIMRDVDLFVGVTSIANDPTWVDHTNRPQDYWQIHSFGDLSESAKSRREVLARLLPRLNLAEAATLEEKFLVIRGTRRTYKIHLGSGNILMSPNDQYLCIVPAALGKGDDLAYVPTEGDNILAIILSKAFMLREDDKITDTTILTQLGR